MKRFRELKIGDQIYTSDNDYGIKELYIAGIIDVNLAHKEYDLFFLGSKKSIRVQGHMLVHTEHIKIGESFIDTRYYSCFDIANEERSMERNIYIQKQFSIAMQAFRRIKKANPDDNTLKNRIYKFFQMNEE